MQRGDFVFYANFVKLCTKKGISPSAAVEEMGFARSAATRWANGSVPRAATLQKVADYFGMSVSELVGEQKNSPSPEGNGLSLVEQAEAIFDIMNEDQQTEALYILLDRLKAKKAAQEGDK